LDFWETLFALGGGLSILLVPAAKESKAGFKMA
jgi:hypothetical protein